MTLQGWRNPQRDVVRDRVMAAVFRSLEDYTAHSVQVATPNPVSAGNPRSEAPRMIAGRTTVTTNASGQATVTVAGLSGVAAVLLTPDGITATLSADNYSTSSFRVTAKNNAGAAIVGSVGINYLVVGFA